MASFLEALRNPETQSALLGFLNGAVQASQPTRVPMGFGTALGMMGQGALQGKLVDYPQQQWQRERLLSEQQTRPLQLDLLKAQTAKANASAQDESNQDALYSLAVAADEAASSGGDPGMAVEQFGALRGIPQETIKQMADAIRSNPSQIRAFRTALQPAKYATQLQVAGIRADATNNATEQRAAAARELNNVRERIASATNAVRQGAQLTQMQIAQLNADVGRERILAGLEGIGLRNQGQLDVTGLRNQGTLENTKLRNQGQLENTGLANEGRMANTALIGQNQLANIGAQGQNALNVAGLNNQGRLENTALVGANQRSNLEAQGVQRLAQIDAQGRNEMDVTNLRLSQQPKEVRIQQYIDSLPSGERASVIATMQRTRAPISSMDPAAVREFQAFSTLSPEDQEKYLLLKRGGLDTVKDINGVPTEVTRRPGASSVTTTPLTTLDRQAGGAQAIKRAEATGSASGTEFVKNVASLRDEAVNSQTSLNAIDAAQRALDSGIRTGFAPQTRQEIARAFTTLTGLPSPVTENTDVFLAAIGLQVGQVIRAFGAGTGLSDADREYAERIASGTIKASPAAIARVLEIGRKAARFKIGTYNEARGRFNTRNPDAADTFPAISDPTEKGNVPYAGAGGFTYLGKVP